MKAGSRPGTWAKNEQRARRRFGCEHDWRRIRGHDVEDPRFGTMGRWRCTKCGEAVQALNDPNG